jgi:hypothetical protein
LEIFFYLKPLRDSKMTGPNVIRTQSIWMNKYLNSMTKIPTFELTLY